ncbi:glucosyl transferase, partial [Fischerella thermalis CCMEE 5328]
MTTKSFVPVVSFKPDLRSAKATRIQRGLAIRLWRVVTLISLDITALISAWSLAIIYGTPLNSPWTQKPSFIILTLVLVIGMIATKGLYKAGIQRRNYPGLVKAITLSQVLLLFIAFLYEPNHYVSRSTFLIFWLSSLLFICIDRYLFDVTT